MNYRKIIKLHLILGSFFLSQLIFSQEKIKANTPQSSQKLNKDKLEDPTLKVPSLLSKKPILKKNTASVPQGLSSKDTVSDDNYLKASPEDADPLKAKYDQKISDNVQNQLFSDLQNYCGDYCKILNIKVNSEEVFDPVNANLGFDSVSLEDPLARHFQVEQVYVNLLVDSSFGKDNINRIKKLFLKLMNGYTYQTQINWIQSYFPSSFINTLSLSHARDIFSQKISSVIDNFIQEYCPGECRLLDLNLKTKAASLDDFNEGDASRFIVTKEEQGALFVEGINIRFALNSFMETQRKRRIERLLREIMAQFGQNTLRVVSVSFPKTADELEKDGDESRKDPFGLNKLQALLKILKDFAFTKEIIKESHTETKDLKDDKAWSPIQLVVFGIVALLTLLLLLLLWKAYSTRKYGKEEQASLSVKPLQNTQTKEEDLKKEQVLNTKLSKRFIIKQLKDDVLKILVNEPKIIEEVFGHILKEDGIEEASKYVSIFGTLIVEGLLDKKELKDDVKNLSEYVHLNTPKLLVDKELELLRKLKSKITAAQMKIKTSNLHESFDFLKTKNSSQLFELLKDESSKNQAIVLSQLSSEQRKAVYDRFEGQTRSELLKALSNMKNISKDYLYNLGEALKRKALHLPEFRAADVHGTDVLKDIIEKLDIYSQKQTLYDLDKNHPEASREIRKSLITLEMLPYLKDGLLIDLFIGLEPSLMTAFLIGVKEHLRNNILGRVPQEISMNWLDNMGADQSLDKEKFKIAYMQVMSKLKSLVSEGLIDIAQINDSIYPPFNAENSESEIENLKIPEKEDDFQVDNKIITP